MRIGTLRHPITIQRSVGQRADFGLSTDQWVTAGQAWASIEPLSGAEGVSVLQVVPTATHRIRLRHQRGLLIDTTMRLAMGSRLFNIAAALNAGETNEYTELICTEVLNDA